MLKCLFLNETALSITCKARLDFSPEAMTLLTTLTTLTHHYPSHAQNKSQDEHCNSQAYLVPKDLVTQARSLFDSNFSPTLTGMT